MPVTAGVQECFAFRLGEKVRLALPADWVQEVVQMAPTEMGNFCRLNQKKNFRLGHRRIANATLRYYSQAG